MGYWAVLGFYSNSVSWLFRLTERDDRKDRVKFGQLQLRTEIFGLSQFGSVFRFGLFLPTPAMAMPMQQQQASINPDELWYKSIPRFWFQGVLTLPFLPHAHTPVQHTGCSSHFDLPTVFSFFFFSPPLQVTVLYCYMLLHSCFVWFTLCHCEKIKMRSLTPYEHPQNAPAHVLTQRFYYGTVNYIICY